MGRGARAAVLVAAAVALAAALRVLYGPGSVGYDAAYALVWGRDLVHLHVPDFSVAATPTPHPLANALGALAAPLGSGALPALVAVSFLSLAALGIASYLLGSRLYSPGVGVLFAVVLLTRDSLVNETLQAVVDVPFLALVLGAAAAEAARPRRGPLVVGLLAAAGLLRPEAWLLSAAYLAYLFPGLDRRRWLQLAALAIAAPVAWAAADLVATGDALHSLHGTQRLADDLARPRSTDVAVRAAPIYLRILLHPPIAIAGVLGALTALWALYARSLLPAALFALGLGAFLVLGVTGLPLLTRYLLPSAAMLALFSAVAMLGWRVLPTEAAGRRAWIAGAAVVAAVLLLTAPADVDRVKRVRTFIAERHEIQGALGDFARRRDVRRALAGCVVGVSTPRAIPDLAFALDRPLADFSLAPGSSRASVSAASPRVAQVYNLAGAPGAGETPAGGRVVARSADWLAAVGLGGPGCHARGASG